MKIKKFQCKIEDLPVIAAFLLSNLKKDLNDFVSFSPLFTSDYLAMIEAKINACKELMNSSIITKDLKVVTKQMYDKSKDLRVKLNALEGYFKLGADKLDVMPEDVGLKSVRNEITRCNIEGVVSKMKMIITIVKRNQPVLEAAGLKSLLIGDIENQIGEINALNIKQYELASERNRLTRENIAIFNDLWDSLQPILKAAKAIYRGVDDVRLREYTISRLIRRINAAKRKNTPEKADQQEENN
jgi:hypothetical protein